MPIFFKSKQAKNTIASGPLGERAYIIGDVHGCLDALHNLLHKIEQHNAEQKQAKTCIVFLGDLIDRGPHSKGVIDFLSTYSPDFAELVFLMGNHEEVFLDILSGSSDALTSWFGFGGKPCARSYEVENLGQIHIDPTPLVHQLIQNVPQHHKDFISGFKDYFIFGDYLCVHAGISPRVKLENQKPHHLRWIRKPFINYKKKHPYIIVHGHTVVEQATNYGNRIALDTGAGKGGNLTALCIEGSSTHFLTDT